MNIIQQLDAEHAKELEAQRAIPEFAPGDTVRVHVKIQEDKAAKGKKKGKDGEDKVRIQAFEGVCIGRSGGGIHENFTVRKISYGEGVERVFPVYSPTIDKIEVVRRGRVRRAKLYYLRGLRGKAARIQEKRDVQKSAK